MGPPLPRRVRQPLEDNGAQTVQVGNEQIVAGESAEAESRADLD